MPGISAETRLAMIEEEVRGLHPENQAIYFNAIANGSTPQMAIGYATQMSPGTKGSNRTLNETQRRKMNNMSEMNRNNIVGIAEKAGIKTNGKFYVGGFGKYNDPSAWISSYDDAIEVCKRKNLTASGIVYHEGHEVDPPKRKEIADDLVDEFTQREMQNPETAAKVKSNPKKLREIREKVKAKHGRKKKD